MREDPGSPGFAPVSQKKQRGTDGDRRLFNSLFTSERGFAPSTNLKLNKTFCCRSNAGIIQHCSKALQRSQTPARLAGLQLERGPGDFSLAMPPRGNPCKSLPASNAAGAQAGAFAATKV